MVPPHEVGQNEWVYAITLVTLSLPIFDQLDRHAKTLPLLSERPKTFTLYFSKTPSSYLEIRNGGRLGLDASKLASGGSLLRLEDPPLPLA